MALFDRLMVEDGATKIVDVGRASFEPFFALASQFGFAEEAHNRGIVTSAPVPDDAGPHVSRGLSQPV